MHNPLALITTDATPFTTIFVLLLMILLSALSLACLFRAFHAAGDSLNASVGWILGSGAVGLLALLLQLTFWHSLTLPGVQ